MHKSNPETLKTLADTTAPEKERAAAADALAVAGLRVVMSKERDAVQLDETLDMWEHPAQLETWGRKHLPIVEPHEALPVKELELDPISLEPLADGYNSASGADWKPVKLKHRVLVRWATERGRLHVDPANLAAELAKGQLSERLKRCRTEATKEELARCAEQLKGQRRATAHHAQQETVIRVAGTVTGDVVGIGSAQVFHGPIGVLQAGSGNVANVSMDGGRLQLSKLLASAFGIGELRRFVAEVAPGTLDSINWEGSLAMVSFDVAETLKRYGYAKRPAFWQALLNARPGRQAEISELMFQI
jgi:hypothetical protein